MRLIDMPGSVPVPYGRVPHLWNPEVIHHKYNPITMLYLRSFIERFYEPRPKDALWTGLELLGYGLEEARRKAFGRNTWRQ